MDKLFQTKCLTTILVIVCILVSLMSCNENSYSSPSGYNLAKPQKMKLGKVLNEISGLSYNSENQTLLAIGDSKKKVFEIDLQTLKLKDFAEKFYTSDEQPDYEDLVRIGKSVYVLISNGTIISVPENAKDSSGVKVFTFWSTDKNDFETLYHDSAANGLVMLCKSCAADKGKNVRSAFRFDLDSLRFDSTAFYSISSSEVKEVVKNDDADFKPSAAAIHPIDKRLYILSSAGNLLVIADTKGKVLEVYNLNPDNHPQAEGITFAPRGTMFISNEGKYGTPTLQVFSYKGSKPAQKNK